MTEAQESMRLDKWLWAARIFKTRNVAADAVTGGKVHCNGERCKPAKLIKPGDRLRVRKGIYELELTVLGFSRQRLAAPAAQALYEESEQSRETRRQLKEQMQLENAFRQKPQHRPNKRERRQLVNLKTRQE